MTNSEFEKRLFRGLKRAGKKAVKTAKENNLPIISWENGKVKKIKPADL